MHLIPHIYLSLYVFCALFHPQYRLYWRRGRLDRYRLHIKHEVVPSISASSIRFLITICDGLYSPYTALYSYCIKITSHMDAISIIHAEITKAHDLETCSKWDCLRVGQMNSCSYLEPYSYLRMLRQWLSGNMSLEEFDSQAQQLISVELHSNLIVQIMAAVEVSTYSPLSIRLGYASTWIL